MTHIDAEGNEYFTEDVLDAEELGQYRQQLADRARPLPMSWVRAWLGESR